MIEKCAIKDIKSPCFQSKNNCTTFSNLIYMWLKISRYVLFDGHTLHCDIIIGSNVMPVNNAKCKMNQIRFSIKTSKLILQENGNLENLKKNKT